jgi:hypothetical protein
LSLISTIRWRGWEREPLFLSLRLTLSSLSDLDRIRIQFDPANGVFPYDVFLSKVAQAIAVLERLEPSCAAQIAPGVPVLADIELRGRVEGPLGAAENFDVAINQATQVLEVRLKKLGGYAGKETGASLVSKILNNDPTLAILRVSDNASEQEGFANICRGTMQFLRNASHHHFKEVSKEDAYKVCVLIDYLLAVLETAKKKTFPDQGSG